MFEVVKTSKAKKNEYFKENKSKTVNQRFIYFFMQYFVLIIKYFSLMKQQNN